MFWDPRLITQAFQETDQSALSVVMIEKQAFLACQSVLGVRQMAQKTMPAQDQLLILYTNIWTLILKNVTAFKIICTSALNYGAK